MNHDLDLVDKFKYDKESSDIELKMTCAGCNRKFHKKTNFEQHFFCPWRGDYNTRRRLRRVLHITPLTHADRTPIYTAYEFAEYMGRSWKGRKYYPRAWQIALDKFTNLSRLVQENIYYYARIEIASYIIQIIKEPEIISGAFSKEE